MKSTPLADSMGDIPDDLTSVGTHHGNQPPTHTGQTVRSPEGPDPQDEPAEPVPALYQLIRDAAESSEQVEVHVHSARAVVEAPDEGEEVGQYRTVDALREALSEVSIDGWTAVFEDVDADRVLVETEVHPDHVWIGQPQYRRISFFVDPDAARAYAVAHERPVTGN